jgi:HicA toxin of bacterial toxin-antitoxin,
VRSSRSFCRDWAYRVVHQEGSHIILDTEEPSHQRIPIPDHNPIRIGTLNTILRLVSRHKALFRTLEGHTNSVNAVAVTLDSRRPASSGVPGPLSLRRLRPAARTWNTFPLRAQALLFYRQMLFSEYASKSSTKTGEFSATHCISVGGPFCIKKLLVQTFTPSSTNTSSTDRSTKTRSSID